MKRLVIILLALFLLIGGGGGAAYFFFLRPAAGPETPEQTAARLKAAEDEKRKARLAETPIVFEPGALPAPLVVNGKVRAYLFLGLKFDLADAETLKKMEEERFPLEEKLLIEINDHPMPLVPGTTNPDLMAAKKQIRAILDAQFGKDKINDVLIAMTYLQAF